MIDEAIPQECLNIICETVLRLKWKGFIKEMAAYALQRRCLLVRQINDLPQAEASFIGKYSFKHIIYWNCWADEFKAQRQTFGWRFSRGLLYKQLCFL